jgi:type II secretory pathway pseudopilin PulG
MKRPVPTKTFSHVVLKEVKDLGRGKRLIFFHRRRILQSIRFFRMTASRKGQAGLGLVETLVAVAILGTCVAAFAAGLSAGAMATGEHRTEAVAQELAQNQLESVKQAPFEPDGTYESVAAPENYAVDVTVAEVPGTDADIQKITVTILRDGESVLALADYKVNR